VVGAKSGGGTSVVGVPVVGGTSVVGGVPAVGTCSVGAASDAPVGGGGGDPSGGVVGSGMSASLIPVLWQTNRAE